MYKSNKHFLKKKKISPFPQMATQDRNFSLSFNWATVRKLFHYAERKATHSYSNCISSTGSPHSATFSLSNWPLLIVIKVEGAFCSQLQVLLTHGDLTVGLPRSHPSLRYLKTSRYNLTRMCFPRRKVVSELDCFPEPSWS